MKDYVQNFILQLSSKTWLITIYPNLTTYDGLKLEQLRKEFKILDKSLVEF